MPLRVGASIPLLKVLTLPRPALANECVQTNAAGQVVLEAKDPLARRHRAHGDVAAEVHAASGSAGAKAKAAPDPLWCPHDCAARSERPTPPRLREHGVQALSSTTFAKRRALVVPQEEPHEPKPPAQEAKPVEREANVAHQRTVRLG